MDKGIDRPGGEISGAKGGNRRTGSPGGVSCKSSLGMQSERAVVWGTSVQTPPARALLLIGVSPRILTFSVDRPVGESGKNLNRQSKPRSRHAISLGAECAGAELAKIAPADVAPSASAQVVRGAVARHSGLPSAARILATSSRPPAASFAVKTRPPCALLPLPGQPRPAGLGTPVPPFVPLSPVLPRQASGWHSLRRGGGVGA